MDDIATMARVAAEALSDAAETCEHAAVQWEAAPDEVLALLDAFDTLPALARLARAGERLTTATRELRRVLMRRKM